MLFKFIKFVLRKHGILLDKISIAYPPKSQIGYNAKIHSSVDFSGYVNNIHIGSKVSINPHVTLSCYDKSSSLVIGEGTIIKPYAMLMTYPAGSIKIGKNCSINPFCVLYGHGGLEIGDNVRIATHTVMIPANHNFDNQEMPITEQGLTKLGIKIGDNVWIGAGVTILDGCEIGSNAVIGAGSVVTKSVAANTVVAGVPNRLIKIRD